MGLRKILPWMASLLVHAVLALVSQDARIGYGTVAAAGPRMVQIVLEQTSPAGRGRAGEPPAARRESQAGKRGALPRSARPAAPRPDAPKETRAPDEAATEQPFPYADSPGAASAEAAGVEGDGAGGAGVRLGWEGEPRRILRAQSVRFPRVLSASGQEVDCEARITVTALGVVSHVEITRSSGYTEIDAGVEAALRGYLFSRDYGFGGKTAVGIVKFRFRLERYD